MPKICFAPIWYPLDNYATSRLRAKYAAELLADHKNWDVRIDYQPDADVAIIIQLCSDRTFQSISQKRSQVVIYDICDRYYDTDNVFRTEEGILIARSRCLELIERADALIVPTRQLKEEMSERFPEKRCHYIPELPDYGASLHPTAAVGSKRLLWFGHTARGNFESARWMIDHLRRHHGFRPVLVTTPRAIALEFPEYMEFCVAWSPDSVRRELKEAELCVLAHAPTEPAKSANRFVTAVVHGVPTLVSESPACLEILHAAGHDDLAVWTTLDIDRLMPAMSDPVQRESIVSELQWEIWRRHGPDVVRAEYLRLIDEVWPPRPWLECR